MRSNYRTLGELVEPIDVRNTDGAITDLVGLSIDKCFIRSVANTIGTDLSKYKVISKNEFAVSLMQVSRDSKIPVACMKDYETAIMSPAYSVFRVKDEDVILPDYLDMWFKRSEFDREAAFIAVGGVRGSMPWDDFARMEVIVPDITKQREIVNEYEVITDRIALKERINDNLMEQAQTLFQIWFENYAPFSLSESGLPHGWFHQRLQEKLVVSKKSIDPQKLNKQDIWHYSIPAYDNGKLPVSDNPQSILSNKYIVPDNSILVSKLNPDNKRIWLTSSRFTDAICSTEFVVLNPIKEEHRAFYYLLFNTNSFMDFLVSNATGSTNSRMRVKPASILNYEFIAPPDQVLDKFCGMVSPTFSIIEDNLVEIKRLLETIPLVIVKLMTSNR